MVTLGVSVAPVSPPWCWWAHSAQLPVDEEVPLLIVLPSQGATDLVVIWGRGHTVEMERQDSDTAGTSDMADTILGWPQHGQGLGGHGVGTSWSCSAVPSWSCSAVPIGHHALAMR